VEKRMRTIVTVKNEYGPNFQPLASGFRRRGPRGWMLPLAGVIGWLASGGARAQSNYSLPFYEPFPSALVSNLYTNQTISVGYANSEELGTAGTPANGAAFTSSGIWTFGNSAGSSSCARVYTTNSQSGLQYPGLTNVDAVYQTGLLGYRPSATSTKNRAVQLIIPTNSSSAPISLYASVLFSIETNTYNSPSSPVPFFGLTTNTTTANSSVNQAGAVIYLNNSFQLQISKGTDTPATNTTIPLAASNTYLLVLRYKYNPGGPGTNADEVDLWVDPTALGSNAVVPPPTISTTNNNNLSSNFFGAVAIFLASGPPFIYMDEIRVATNWGGVTPGTPPPGNIYSVTGGGAGCGNTGFSVGLSGADANVTYFLYTNGIPTGQSINGPSTTFGLQTAEALYTVLGSNTVNNNVGWMSGGVSVTLLSAPTITAQPLPLTAPSGELGCFTVGATGGGETYQWYKGGVALANGNEFSGVQTSNLVIFPVTSQDVATTANGYYVVLSNQCGTSATISTTNALSLGSPANLTWYGDGVLNLWDVAISTNWNMNTAYFHYGDNVTFDDSSPNPNVTLNNSFLSPSTITVNGFFTSYVFGGPGGLAGSGSILMNSTESLTLATPNSMSGGLTVSNGQVIFNGGSTLGTGPITLAGGELTAANIGLVYLDNPIIVTGSNSAISTSATGGQPLVVTNTITGVFGNLSFVNTASKNGQPTIYLGAPFTFGLPVTLNGGSSDLGILVAASNTVGSQIWNNWITGGGELQRDGAGGATILNDTNNYNGDDSGENSQGTVIGTLLTDGLLGVGVNSTNDVNGNLIGALGSAALAIDTRGAGTPQLFAYGGPRVVSNAITWYSNVVGSAWVINGANELTLAGGIDMNETNRAIDVSNTAPTILSGIITDDGQNCGWTITGPGSLYLDGANTYTGGTTNTGGLLAGTGSVAGSVVVASGSALGGGDPSTIGAFTINGNLSLGGNFFIRLNKSLSPSNDSITVTGGLTNTGSGVVTASNAGPALAVGNKFTLLSSPLVNGGALTITGGGVNWNNNLAADGSISVASIIVTQPPPPRIVSASVSGGNLVFSGTNGTAGLTYYVLSSTNLALALTNWTAVSTNVFGASGAFSVTNALGAGSKYFTLKVLP
jgi:autotransporter-associated beta strand protein